MLDEAICHTDRMALSGFSCTEEENRGERQERTPLFFSLLSISRAACLSVTCKHQTSIMGFFVLNKSLSLAQQGWVLRVFKQPEWWALLYGKRYKCSQKLSGYCSFFFSKMGKIMILISFSKLATDKRRRART